MLGAVFEVTNTLGAGFLEKVYQPALLRELGLRGIRAVAEASFTVTYTGHSAGEYCAELSASLRPDPLSSGQFPEAESRVEAYRPGVWGWRTA